MRDLYDRLKAVGFDRRYLQEHILPDWWDDSLSEVPYNRALAEAAIATHLGYKTAILRDSSAILPQLSPETVQFKRNRKVDVRQLLPALQIVRRASELVVSSANFTPCSVKQTASQVRESILRHRDAVDFESLIEYCWSAGLPVIRVSKFPKKSAKFDGVAMRLSNRYIIALTSGRDGPPWLAFHLAHELGHIMCSHITSDNETLVDSALSNKTDDQREIEADHFACEVLTGFPQGLRFHPTHGLKGRGLARAAQEYIKSQGLAVDPGVLCLFYCKTADRWGVAQDALEELNLEVGGAKLIESHLIRHLTLEKMSESSIRFLESTCEMAVSSQV